MAAIFRNHVHCQFYFRGAERSDITMEVLRNRVRQIIGKGVVGHKKKTISRGFFRGFLLLYSVPFVKPVCTSTAACVSWFCSACSVGIRS